MQTNSIISSQRVWILVDSIYKAAIVTDKNQKRKQIQCQLENDNKIIIVPKKFCYSRSTSNKNYNDMCTMEILNQPQILNNLMIRYHHDQIHTSIGTTLIVINPYKHIENLYSQQCLETIRNSILKYQNVDNENPHIFLTVGRAFIKLKNNNKRQSIVISGESGAGKTQNTKYCMKFITALSHIHSQNETKKSIQDIILQSNPILQQFGNCKTIRNNNSSRFGKFVRLFINKNAHISGTSIENYLLEKSRVTSCAKNQRTFHVFYGLINSKYRLLGGLQSQQQYHYLTSSGCLKAQGINDKVNFEILLSALKNIKLSKSQISTIFMSLGSILLLGNIQFNNRENIANPNMNCEFKDDSIITRICKNLNINYIQLNDILLQQKIAIGKQTMIKKYNKTQCEASRNTLSKALYNRIFDFLVQKINKCLNPSKQLQNSINILDIFGFQMFQNNGFEQLCINFTNQKLQKLYIKYIFENQIEELSKDGLNDKIKQLIPPNNNEVIQLIQKKVGISVFSMIDEKTTLVASKDEDIIKELRKIKNKCLHVDNQPNETTFMIIHTQSPVIYDVKGFKFKNQDSITLQIQSLINKLFPIKNNNEQKGKTLVTKFDKQLRTLHEELQSSQLHFVRCIKPNETKSPLQINEKYVLQQIKYMGVLQTIQIRKNTFSYRMQKTAFINYYKSFVQLDKNFHKLSLSQQSVFILRKIIPGIQKIKNSYQLGKSKIYLKYEYQTELNEFILRDYRKKDKAASVIQKQFQRYQNRLIITSFLKLFISKMSKLKSILLKTQKQNKRVFFKKYKQNIFQLMKILNQRERSKAIEDANNKLLQITRSSDNKLYQTQIKNQQQNQKQYQTLTPTKTKQQRKSFSNKHMSALSGIQNYQTITKFHEPGVHDQIIFEGQIIIDFYDEEKCHLKRLLQIITHTTQVHQNEDKQPLFSKYYIHLINQDTKKQDLQKIKNFNYIQYFNKIFRKKKTSFGRIKSVQENLKFKSEVMGASLLILSSNDQKKALQVFKFLIEIGDQKNQKLIGKILIQLIQTLVDASQLLVDEIFIQILKQQNSQSQYTSIAMIRTISILLHFHQISKQILLSGMSFLLSKYQDRQTKRSIKQPIDRIFPRILRQYYQTKVTKVKYIPVQYQFLALFYERQLRVSVFFPIGQQIIISVEYFQTFNDIKEKVRKQCGINSNRFSDQMLTFVEILNCQNSEMTQNPIDESRRVWDILTQWSNIEKLKKINNKPVVIILMMKLKHAFQLYPQDKQGIQLVYSQCYFDLFIGNIIIPKHLLILNLAIMKTVHPKIKDESLIPMRIVNIEQQKQQYINQINTMAQTLKGRSRNDLHYQFIRNCQKDIVCMGNCYNTNSNIKLFLKLKKIIIAEGEKRQEISIRKIKSWDNIDNNFLLTLKENNSEDRVITIPLRQDYGQILSNNILANMNLLLKIQGQS